MYAPQRARDICTGDFSDVKDGKTYCEVMDVSPGDCLTSQQGNSAPFKVSCTAPGDKNTVTNVSPFADELLCGDEGAYVSGDPSQTICFTGPDKQSK